MPLQMQVYNIQQFLVNNGYDPQTIDVAAYIDSNLSLTENKKLFAAKLNIPIRQMGGQKKAAAGKNYNRAARKEVDASYCDFLAHNCEQNCNDGACKVYKKEGCPGAVEPCKKDRFTKTTRRKAAEKAGGGTGCVVTKYCVAPHTRPPQHNSRTGKDILVKGYCVEQHPRLCRRSGYT
jgi:hypothetical protein